MAAIVSWSFTMGYRPEALEWLGSRIDTVPENMKNNSKH